MDPLISYAFDNLIKKSPGHRDGSTKSLELFFKEYRVDRVSAKSSQPFSIGISTSIVQTTSDHVNFGSDRDQIDYYFHMIVCYIL